MKWLADENFDNDVIRGLLRQSPGFDVLRVQDIDEISGASDLAVLGWATANARIILTHDLSTMHIEQSRVPSCSPIVLVRDSLPVGVVIEDIRLLDECSVESDWSGGVIYLPLL